MLTFDYIGALGGVARFPLPPRAAARARAHVVRLRAAERAVALWALWLFRALLAPFGLARARRSRSWSRSSARASSAPTASPTLAEDELYADDIVHAQSSRYQRIVVTRWRDGLQLFLNGNLQFSSADEYRYHEALVHPALATLPARAPRADPRRRRRARGARGPASTRRSSRSRWWISTRR